MDPYKILGNAVVLQAVKDWRGAMAHLKRHPRSEEAKIIRDECEWFFLSEHFMLFTDLDGKALLEKLRREG